MQPTLMYMSASHAFAEGHKSMCSVQMCVCVCGVCGVILGKTSLMHSNRAQFSSA